MTKNDLKTCVAFRSQLFNVDWPNEELGVEGPDELGKDCAELLMESLRSHQSLSHISDAERDDWGWCFYVDFDKESYYIRIMGAMAPPPVDWWVVQVSPLGFFWWLFRRPRKHLHELLGAIDQSLTTTDGISNVTWMTVEEYMDNRGRIVSD